MKNIRFDINFISRRTPNLSVPRGSRGQRSKSKSRPPRYFVWITRFSKSRDCVKFRDLYVHNYHLWWIHVIAHYILFRLYRLRLYLHLLTLLVFRLSNDSLKTVCITTLCSLFIINFTHKHNGSISYFRKKKKIT